VRGTGILENPHGPGQTSPGVGDGETGSEAGAPLDTYSHALPGMQEQAVNTIIEPITNAYK
jgi:hypothetical protein